MYIPNLYKNYPIITLVGKTNVGKSTLFNRMNAQFKHNEYNKIHAIVYHTPGVTRDLKYTCITIQMSHVILVDTPGVQLEKNDIMQRMCNNSIAAIKAAHLICFVVDDIVSHIDLTLAKLIKNNCKSCILVINKCEKQFYHNSEYYSLGFKQIIPISALHGINISDLEEAIIDHIGNTDNIHIKYSTINFAIVGKPNVGKSTFINAILNSDRMLVSSECGTTRESVATEFNYKFNNNNYILKLIDTAGLRRKENIKCALEKYSASDTINSIRSAHIVILMIDAIAVNEMQNFDIGHYAIREGRGLIIVINKYDLVNDRRYQDNLNRLLSYKLPELKNIPTIFISAKYGHNINEVLHEAVKVYLLWNNKISTPSLNKWLVQITAINKPPLDNNHKPTKIKYITQIKTRPPIFKLFTNNTDLIIEYRRYLLSSLCEYYKLYGVPAQIIFDKSHNPYR